MPENFIKKDLIRKVEQLMERKKILMRKKLEKNLDANVESEIDKIEFQINYMEDQIKYF